MLMSCKLANWWVMGAYISGATLLQAQTFSSYVVSWKMILHKSHSESSKLTALVTNRRESSIGTDLQTDSTGGIQCVFSFILPCKKIGLDLA